MGWKDTQKPIVALHSVLGAGKDEWAQNREQREKAIVCVCEAAERFRRQQTPGTGMKNNDVTSFSSLSRTNRTRQLLLNGLTPFLNENVEKRMREKEEKEGGVAKTFSTLRKEQKQTLESGGGKVVRPERPEVLIGMYTQFQFGLPFAQSAASVTIVSYVSPELAGREGGGLSLIWTDAWYSLSLDQVTCRHGLVSRWAKKKKMKKKKKKNKTILKVYSRPYFNNQELKNLFISFLYLSFQ